MDLITSTSDSSACLDEHARQLRFAGRGRAASVIQGLAPGIPKAMGNHKVDVGFPPLCSVCVFDLWGGAYPPV